MAVSTLQHALAFSTTRQCYPIRHSIIRSSYTLPYSIIRKSSPKNDISLASPVTLQQRRRQFHSCMRKNDIRKALQALREMLAATPEGDNDQNERIIDGSFALYFDQAFAPPYRTRGARKRVMLGLEAIILRLEPPHATLPKSVLVRAIHALTELDPSQALPEAALHSVNSAFRLLQRLVTGAGVRGHQQDLSETDFNRVLNAYCELGRMERAHRVIALQERTPHAPPLSPVTYSILLKGYGRQKSASDIDMIVKHAEKGQVVPDTIMCNSLIDAYINCGMTEQALQVFRDMNEAASTSTPRPNRRTYNTVLKGLAHNGALHESIALSKEMKEKRLWDAITTNTLVQAAVTSNQFDVAEKILKEHTTPVEDVHSNRHPNVEAYSNLIDGYAKVGDLNRALSVLRSMRTQGVQPNAVTYTCIVGGMARQGRVEEAKKMMKFMDSVGLPPTAVTYNAFLSGLLERKDDNDNVHVVEAIGIFKSVFRNGIRPNAVTVSILVEAYGRCDPPQVAEAQVLVKTLIADGVISSNNNRVMTALIRTCAKAHDMDGVKNAFEMLQSPDIIAVNAYLDACDDRKQAMTVYEKYIVNGDLHPDVVTYSSILPLLISANDTSKARKLYRDMTEMRGIAIDTTLVDTLLKSIISKSRENGLKSSDQGFLAIILRDAERLDWKDDGRLNIRKRAVQAVLKRSAGIRYHSELHRILQNDDDNSDSSSGDMFAKHGWNKVDSGFRLWGGGNEEKSLRKDKDGDDDFLKSKGWNNVDSGFRII